MTTPGGGIELAQIWVPLMPEASKLAAGVEKIGRDAERRFGQATKTMGASMARNVETNAGRLRSVLADVEKRTQAVERAKRKEADAQGRVNVAEQRYHELRNSSKAKESQRVQAYERMTAAQRAHEASTKALTRETRMLEEAQRRQQAVQNGNATRMPLGANMLNQGENAGQSWTQGFGRALRTGAALAGFGGFAMTLKKVVTAGVEMESNLNRLQGVTSASADEMARASKLAQQLGADTSIVGATSASAAAGMLELAKGGLTLEQSMAAARGTLELAAAADIDAAKAAESQAAILNSFQLMPEQAGHVADVLANVANAAAGEVPDFMSALQQAATVAHGFGISMEDTVAVMGLFAKAGILGSDAGTSLKTMLTHLANPSNAAAQAMERLGVVSHDVVTGEFVGVHELFRQIGEAGKSMRPDDFQRDVAKLFGTDAIRGAMIAGNQGVETLNQMSEAVTEVGGASKMASANMQGVPGALESVSNAAAGVSGSLYDMMKPLLISGAESALGLLERAQESLDKLKSGGGGPGLQMIADGWKNIMGAVKDIGPELVEAVGSLLKGAAGTVVAGWSALGLAFKVIEPPAKALLSVLNAIPGGLTTAAAIMTALYAKSKLTGPVMSLAAKATGQWAKAFSGWTMEADAADRTMTRIVNSQGETVLMQRGYMTQVRDAYRTGAEGASRFSRSVGVAKGAMAGLKIAGGGVMSMLGGPWGIAALGLTGAMALITSAHQKAAEAAEKQRREEEALQNTLDKSTGAITEETREEIARRFTDEGTSDRAVSYGIDPNKLVQAATGDGQAYADIMNQAIERGIQPGLEQINYVGAGGVQVNWDVIKKQIGDAGVTTDELTAALLRQGDAWDQVQQKLNDAAGDPSQALSLQKLIDQMPDANESIITMAQNLNEVQDQLGTTSEKQRLFNETLNGSWEVTQRGIEAFGAMGAAVKAVPSDKQVVVEVPEDKRVEFLNKMQEFGNTVEQLPDGTIVVTANTAEAERRFQDYTRQIERTKVDVHLNPVWGDLGSGHAAAAARQRLGEVVGHGGRASGGMVDSNGMISGPGSGTSDSILAQVLGGRGGFVRVSNRESINTERSTRANWPVIDAMNKGANLTQWFRQLPAFAGGGAFDLEDAVSEMSGAPYVRGGAGPSGADCSGAMSYLVNRALGLPTDSRMATGNAGEWLAERGFVEGSGGPGTFRIGWYNGGPGGGHMAGTLPDGTNVESGGSVGNFTAGGSVGADDPKFTNQMYLPVDALYPDGDPYGSGGGYGGSFGSGGGSGGAGGSGPTGAERRALRNAAQKIEDTAKSVESAQKALEELSPNAKESTRMNAQKRLDKAIREHEDAINDEAELREETAQKVRDRASKGGKGSGGSGNFGQDLFNGMLEAIGLDGSVFGNPFEWGIWKLFTGGANWLGGILQKNDFSKPRLNPYAGDPASSEHGRGFGSPGPGNAGDGGMGQFQLGDGGGMSSLGDTLLGAIPGVGDFLPSPATQAAPIDASINIHGNVDRGTFNDMKSANLSRVRSAGSGLKGMGGF